MDRRKRQTQDSTTGTDTPSGTSPVTRKTRSVDKKAKSKASGTASSKSKAVSEASSDSSSRKKTTRKAAAKKTTRKAAAKKTTKKAAAKKTAKKVTTKKAAKKVTTKKVAAKKTTRKVAAKKTARKVTAKKTARKVDGDKQVEKSAEKSRTRSESDKKTAKRSRKKSDKPRDGRRTNSWGRTTRALPDATDSSAPENRIVVVNEVPGEECRIAILDHNRLDEYFVERSSSATVVGNIYKARVTNIEPAIQAAFVDFGLGESGFLHVSDLHPQYFPGESVVEQVGKKIPRRQRPPIQDALSKGQEILVQVLKQGIGSKGPTLTSYLSIPGRLMVMMPNMDRVGVSRKVANDEQRKSMREILDSLALPEGFGFIVRTAGFKASKAELKRDVAYLNRLWEQIDRRKSSTGAPCLLYAESDILIRTIRDVVDSTVTRVLIDDPSAFERATGFLKVAAPRAAPDVRYYDQSMPIFSAYDVERQIDQIHEETVPLKSGGALVIQQTEALVAIDVNSGRSRSAKDSESNAYETNIEAVDEICRQLRLRDLGGVIINDLIDMRQQKNRQDIEARMVKNLGRDRAKTTVLPISEFGIVEMTRQRMRPNTQKANYDTCSLCSGRGVLLRLDAVASDAIRRAAAVLDDNVTKTVELVCSSEVASTLKNDRRQTIAVLEERFQKSVSVRVSETMPNDRVDLYAYDSRGADLEVKKKGIRKLPNFDDFPESLDEEDLKSTTSERKSGKRRRRRRGKTAPADATAIALAGGFEIDDEEEDEDIKTKSGEQSSDSQGEEEGTGRKRRRRRGGRNRRRKSQDPDPATLEPIRIHALAKELGVTSREILDKCAESDDIEVKNHMSSVSGESILTIRNWFKPQEDPNTAAEASDEEGGERQDSEDGGGRRKRRRRRRGRRNRNRNEDGDTPESTESGTEGDEPKETETGDEEPSNSEENGEAPRKRRRRRRGRKRRGNSDAEDTDSGSNGDDSGKASISDQSPDNDAPHETAKQGDVESKPKRRRSRKRSRKHSNDNGEASRDEAGKDRQPDGGEQAGGKSDKKTASVSADKPKETVRKPRTLYGGRIRRVGPGEQSNMGR